MAASRSALNPTAHRCRHRPVPRQSGFTLSELMVTMAIIAILIGIGVPSYRYITTSNRMSAEINGLLGDLQFARSEAVREGQTITVCSSNNGATCAASNTWSQGWIVYSDLNGNLAPDAGEILRIQRTLVPDSMATGVSQLQFNREGFALGLGAATVVTLHDSTNNSKYARCLQISIVGMLATSSNATDGTCT